MEKQNEMLEGESMIPANIQHSGIPDEAFSLAGNYIAETSYAQINIYPSIVGDEVGNAVRKKTVTAEQVQYVVGFPEEGSKSSVDSA